MWCIVGLGNPGPQYRGTRHNVGYEVIDGILERAGLRLTHREPEVWWTKGVWCDQQVILAKPMTFMNLSGQAVLALKKRGCERTRLIVVHDDMDLPVGRLKFKEKGGDAGHKGVRSILDVLGEDRFLRLRIGVGRPPRGMDPAQYVLEPIPQGERSAVEESVDRAIRGLEVLLTEGLDAAMRLVHPRPPVEEREGEGAR